MKTFLLTIAVLTSSGCAGASSDAEEVPPIAHAAGVVDSIFPIEEELRRFRLDLGPEPAQLRDGEGSRDALVESFVRAVEQRDTARLRQMHLTRAEFAYLYFPHTRFMREPLQTKPGLIWFQIVNGSSRGTERLFKRVAGSPMGVTGYDCAAEEVVEGPNRIWTGCTIRRRSADGAEMEQRLFGSIIDRDGHYKFVSYQNEF